MGSPNHSGFHRHVTGVPGTLPLQDQGSAIGPKAPGLTTCTPAQTREVDHIAGTEFFGQSDGEIFGHPSTFAHFAGATRGRDDRAAPNDGARSLSDPSNLAGCPRT